MMGAFQDRSKINQAIKTDIENSVLCWLATVDTAGVPNVSPKEIFDSYNDDRIVIADIASSNSVGTFARILPSASVSLMSFASAVSRLLVRRRSSRQKPTISRSLELTC